MLGSDLFDMAPSAMENLAKEPTDEALCGPSVYLEVDTNSSLGSEMCVW